MPEPTTIQTEKPQIHPYVEGIAKQIGKSIEDILTPEPAVEEPSDLPAMIPEPVSAARPPKAAEVKPDPEPEPEKKDPETKEPVKHPENAPVATTDQRPVIKIVKREPAPPAPAPTIEPPKPPAAPTAEDQALQQEEAYIQTLTPEQQEELKIAKYAEKNGKKGLYKQYLDYFKAVDAHIEANPNPDPEDFDKFLQEKKPKVTDAELRRAERAMLNDELDRRAEEKARAMTAPVEREIRAIKVKPVIEQTMADIEADLTREDSENKDLVAIPKDAVEAIRMEGAARAAERFPEEVPILLGVQNASREWLNIRNGVVDLDTKNPTHQYLIQFIAQEGNRMLQKPDSEKVRDGKRFLPLHLYQKMLRENPEQAQQHYTFSDEDIVDLLKNQGKIDYTNRITALKNAGWVKAPPKVSAPGEVATPPATPTPAPAGATINSPRAGARALPGASEEPGNNSKLEAEFPHLRGLSKL